MSEETEVIEGQEQIPEDSGYVVEPPTEDAPLVVDSVTPGEPTEQTETEEETSETTEEPVEESVAEPEKPRSRYQERIDDLTAQRRQAERRAAQLEQQVAKLQHTTGGQTEPKESDFDDYASFVKATALWAASQNKVALVHEAKQEAEIETQRAYEEFQGEKLVAGQEKYKDFGEKVSKLGDVFTPATEAYHALFESENFADVAYYLSNNLNEARRIIGLSPRAQAREITKLEINLENNPVIAPTKKVSNAPAPVGTAKGTKEAGKKTVESMSTEEYAKYRWQQRQGRR